MSQITTLTLLKFTSVASRIWAFGMMQFAHAPLAKVNGLEFYRLLGTGRDGFDPKPDLSTYALLQVWEQEDNANAFFTEATLFEKYKNKSSQHYTLFLKNILARGEWGGSNPFKKSSSLADTPLIAVITRATIKTKFLYRFWKYVPKSQQHLKGNDGLLFTKGVGEVPIKNMATFSIWKDLDSLNRFAYQTSGHVKAIGKTRSLQWYSEELFSRFQPYKSLGTWDGIDFLDTVSGQEIEKK